MPTVEPPRNALAGRPGSSGARAAYAIYNRPVCGQRVSSAPAGRRAPGVPEGPAMWVSYRAKEARQAPPKAEPISLAKGPTHVQQQTLEMKRGEEKVMRFVIPSLKDIHATPARLRIRAPGPGWLMYVHDIVEPEIGEEPKPEPAPRDYRWMCEVPEESGTVEMGFGDAAGEWLVAVYSRLVEGEVTAEWTAGEAVAKQEDYKQPWKVCSQEVWSGEQQELLSGWFQAEQREFFVSDTKNELVDENGRNPLHACCAAPLKGALRWAHQLTGSLRKYVDAEAADKWGRTPLHEACRFADDFSERNYSRAAALVTHLVQEAGVTVDVEDAEGNTPLHELCQCDTPPSTLVELLLRYGAIVRVNAKALSPQTLARLSNNNHNAACVELWLTGCMPTEKEERRKRALRKREEKEDAKLVAFEDNFTNTLLSDRQLREEFSRFDTQEKGFISVHDFNRLKDDMIERYGGGVGAAVADACVKKYNMLAGGDVSYEAFALMMLRLGTM